MQALGADAIKSGYRLIDTAASYTNEDAVGEAVKEAVAQGICTREELFITSKMWVQDMQNYETAKAAIDASLNAMGLEYLDLYLLHQAMKDYFSAWRAMEDAYKEGKLRAIGVSNFYPHTLTNFCETVEIKPMVNQVELHPYFTQENALETMKYYEVQPEAWAPLGGGRYKPFDDPMLQKIAAAHGKDGGPGDPTLERPARCGGHPQSPPTRSALRRTLTFGISPSPRRR